MYHSFLILFVCSCVELNSTVGLTQASRLPGKAVWGGLLCFPYLPWDTDNTACCPPCPCHRLRDLQGPLGSPSARDPHHRLRDNYSFRLFPSWWRADSARLPHECLHSRTKEKQYSEKIMSINTPASQLPLAAVKEERFSFSLIVFVLQGFRCCQFKWICSLSETCVFLPEGTYWAPTLCPVETLWLLQGMHTPGMVGKWATLGLKLLF